MHFALNVTLTSLHIHLLIHCLSFEAVSFKLGVSLYFTDSLKYMYCKFTVILTKMRKRLY